MQWPCPCPSLEFLQTANCNSVLVIIIDVVLIGQAAHRTSNPALGAEETQFQLCHSISPCSAFLCPPTAKNPQWDPSPALKLLSQMPPNPQATAAFLLPCIYSCPISDLGLCIMPSPPTPMPPHNSSFPTGMELTLLLFFLFVCF